MAIDLRPRFPIHPRALQDLARDIQQATGEEVGFVEVRSAVLIEIIDIVLENAFQAVAVAIAFAQWRRQRREEQPGKYRQVKGIIWGPDGEILREVSEEED